MRFLTYSGPKLTECEQIERLHEIPAHHSLHDSDCRAESDEINHYRCRYDDLGTKNHGWILVCDAQGGKKELRFYARTTDHF